MFAYILDIPRYLDKLIDELAKGKAMEKILHGQVQVCEATTKANGKTYIFDAVIKSLVAFLFFPEYFFGYQ